jgi:hypothetical protein
MLPTTQPAARKLLSNLLYYTHRRTRPALCNPFKFQPLWLHFSFARPPATFARPTPL